MWRRCVIAPRYIPPRPPPRAGIVRRTPRHSPCAHAVAGDDHAASCRRNAVRLPFRRRACGLRLVRNRARRAGVGRHRDPACRADPGHARGGRPGTSLGHGLSARWRHPHHRTPRHLRLLRIPGGLSAPLERRTQGGRAGAGRPARRPCRRISPRTAWSTCPMPRPATAAPAPLWDAATWPMTGPAWRISASCPAGPKLSEAAFRFPPGAGRQRVSLHRAGREQPALHRARPGQAAGKIVRIRRRLGAAGQSLCGQGRRAPRDLVLWPPQSAGHGVEPLVRRAVGKRAWARGGDEVNLIAGAELRLAPGDLRHRLFRPAHPRGARPDAAGHGVAAVLVAEVARHQRHGVLRRVQVSGLASFAFIGALAERNLIRLTLDGDKVVAQERLLGERGKRIRDVRVGPDGQRVCIDGRIAGRAAAHRAGGDEAMKTYELIGSAGCGSAIVEMALALANVPHAGRRALPEAGAAARPPAAPELGQVPTLVTPDGEAATESAAMILHLHRRGAAGWPGAVARPARERARFLNPLIRLVAAIYPTFTYARQSAAMDHGRRARRPAARARAHAPRRTVAGAGAAGRARRTCWASGFGAGPVRVAVMTRWRPGPAWFESVCPALTAVAREADAIRPRLARCVATSLRPPNSAPQRCRGAASSEPRARRCRCRCRR